MSQVVLAEDTVFAERYRIVRLIAQGGMGAVYEVVHTKTNKHRALKVMHSNIMEDEGMEARFEQEARVTSGIESEFIVEVLDAGVDGPTRMPYLVMELLRGEDLNRKLKRVKRFEPQDVLVLLKQVATALDKTHKASIVHRDLKPENLFLTERDDGSPRIKILDFGVAKLISESATGQAATQSLGTPLFMAPEQFTLGSPISPATDIYALGFIAYQLLVGTHYWQDEVKAGANIYAFVGVALQGIKEAPSARAARRGVMLPSGFDAWLGKAAALNPKDRFSSASAAIRELVEVFGGGHAGEGRSSAVSLPSAPVLASLPGMSEAAGAHPEWKQSVPIRQGNEPVANLPVEVDEGATLPLITPAHPESGVPSQKNQTGQGLAASAFHEPGWHSSKRGFWIAAGLAGALTTGIGLAVFSAGSDEPDRGDLKVDQIQSSTAGNLASGVPNSSAGTIPEPRVEALSSAPADPVPAASETVLPTAVPAASSAARSGAKRSGSKKPSGAIAAPKPSSTAKPGLYNSRE